VNKMDVTKAEKNVNAITLLLEIMGLQYFSLKKLSTKNVEKGPTRPRLLQMVLNLTFYLSVLICLPALLSKSRESEDTVEDPTVLVSKNNILMVAMLNSMGLSLVFNVVISIILSYNSTREIKKFFLNTRKIIQMVYQDFNAPFETKRINRAAWTRLATMIVLCYLFFGSMMSTYGGLSLSFLIRVLLTLPMVGYLVLAVFKYLFFVDIIYYQLELLISVLANKTQLHVEIANGFEGLLIDTINVSSRKGNFQLLKRLKTARKVFRLIIENVDLVNSSNGLTVLTYMTVMVIMLISRCYEVIVIDMEALPQESFIASVYGMALASVIITTTVGYCQRTTSMVMHWME
jgi:hypothetical protein